MKASDFIVDEIHNQGINKVFGYIGGMVAHLVDSIYKNPNVEMINTINEQGAGFAAEGLAKVNSVPSVAIATSGPGATNLITSIADCYFDSVPVLFITGQVNTYEYKKYNIKQSGFQETNIVDMVKPITKYSTMITDVSNLKYEIQKAFYIMQTGRKGPVLLDIPMDIQSAEINLDELHSFVKPDNDVLNSQKNIDLQNIFMTAKKPLILLGNGIKLSNAVGVLNDFLAEKEIPVVQSLLGVGVVPYEYSYNTGFIGTYGNRYGNIALSECDLLLVLGSRLDIRQTGSNIDLFKSKTIIHVDIDINELKSDKFDKIIIHSDLKDFLSMIKNARFSDISEWKNRIIKLKKLYSTKSKIFSIPNIFLEKVWDYSQENDIFLADVGQNQMWVAQSAKIKNNQKFITSGGHGSMGFALPASIGTSFQNRSIVITGDGGVQMNIQELEIIKRRNLPIKIIVMNNSNLGMVRTFQELYFGGRYPSTVWDYSAPDFALIAKSYGIVSKTFNIENITDEDIKAFMSDNEPTLINILMPTNTQVEPRLQFGNPINMQHPIIEEAQ